MINTEELVARFVIAALFGGIVGIQREIHHKTAGFRTNILICLGSTLLTIISLKITLDYTSTVADPGRIAAQIVTGIGFLGAGAIIRGRGAVIGLTTAASIWVTAAIGMAVGMGYYLEAGITVITSVIILQGLLPFERMIHGRVKSVNYYLKYAQNPDIDSFSKKFYDKSAVKYEGIRLSVEGNFTIIQFSVLHPPKVHDKFLEDIHSIDSEVLCIKF